MIKVFDKRFLYLEFEIDNLIKKFDSEGNSIKDSRNKLKEFKCNGENVIIKSFTPVSSSTSLIAQSSIFSFNSNFPLGKSQKLFLKIIKIC